MGGAMTGSTVTSPQMGSITLNTANRIVWGEGNASENITDWSPNELQNFVKWFIEVHHPEAVKQYQAIRAIERKAEEAAKVEAELAQLEMMKQYWANQANAAQNIYPYNVTSTQQGYGIAVSTDPPRKSFWERCKELAKRPLSHGDYY